MRTAGVTVVALDVVVGNEVAQKFFEREGFTTTLAQMHRLLPIEPEVSPSR